MSVDVILGMQWGDEGKGRVVDYYAREYGVAARFAGGDNAGHSLVRGGETIALRLTPSAILHPQVELFIGGGCVVNPWTLIEELDMLARLRIDGERLRISDRAHAVLPEHLEVDKRRESEREHKIGTTGRGIGPAYADRASRTGVTMASFCAGDSPEARRLLPHVVDGVAYLHDRLDAGVNVLAEGAQGAMLDVVYGTYPFVTSSSTIAGSVCTGLGVGPKRIGRVVGVAKAYCTRVGEGPFPSELENREGEYLRKQGHEFGTVTGRPRRCGWFDAVAARYAIRTSGIDAIALTKLDVLSGLQRLGVVVSYAPGGAVATEYLEGWADDIRGVRRVCDLPAAARRYVDFLREVLCVPIEVVCVGPERDDLARS
ncbi:MAG: adenylosuccinate synthetase [Candidatus Tyrphobacter sp.]